MVGFPPEKGEGGVGACLLVRQPNAVRVDPRHVCCRRALPLGLLCSILVAYLFLGSSVWRLSLPPRLFQSGLFYSKAC